MAGVVSKTVAKEVERYHCKVCGHNWEGRPYRWKSVDRDSPFKCPKCGSRYWWF